MIKISSEYQNFFSCLNHNFNEKMDWQLTKEQSITWKGWSFEVAPINWTRDDFYRRMLFSTNMTTKLHSFITMNPNYQKKDVEYFCCFLADKAMQLFKSVDLKDFQGTTPLMLAAGRCQMPALKILLYHKANPNLADQIGKSSLHYLLDSNGRFDEKKEIAKLLLANGASLNISTNHVQNKLVFTKKQQILLNKIKKEL